MEDVSSRESISVSRVGVFQSLANNDPDVDAIYRLAKEIPFSFRKSATIFAAAPGRVAPFNAQATLWTKDALWGMLLPVTVHGRVSDIWRSYFMQRLMKDLDIHVAFTSPIAVQYRNVHSYIADLQAEVPLYVQANELTKWLRDWMPKKGSGLVARFEQLYIDLYEIGVIEEDDVLLAQAWLTDLAAIGFKEPRMKDAPAVREKAPEPVVESKPKVAVCVSGQVRTLSLGLDDPDHPKDWAQARKYSMGPPNMTVAESIQQNLFPKLGKPDVFMVISTREREREPKSGDLSTCEPLRPMGGGNLYCAVPKETPINIVDVDMWDDFITTRGNPSKVYETKHGFLQQLKGLFECHQMIKKREIETGVEYDWVVRLRPDEYVHKFPTLDSLSIESDKPVIFFANRDTCCCGNEDKLGIARRKWMKEYFDRFLYLQQTNWNHPPDWRAERYVMLFVKQYGIDMVEHRGMEVCTLKPLHRNSRSSP